MSELESLCEEVLEDEDISASEDNVNNNKPISRNKRDSSSSTTQPSNSRSSSVPMRMPKYPKHMNSKNLSFSSNRIRNRAYTKSRMKSRWVLLRKKRRRRRRSRVKLIFKMIGN